MIYGKHIGKNKKFNEDGTVLHYPGNTVVADVTPGCSAYEVMCRLRQMVIDAGFDDTMILLPEDSYHMTIIRGLNDLVRTDERWPAKLPKDTPMEKVDDYVSAAVASAEMPGRIRMKFDCVHQDEGAIIIRLLPANEEIAQMLQEFRDKVATAIGLFLPKHNEYRFHISLAYIRIKPEGEEGERFEALKAEMQKYIEQQSEFEMTPPYMAYYDDMLAFHAHRIPRY